MSLNFKGLFPALQQPLVALSQTEWLRTLNQTAWLFAIVETAHLIFLVILGGAVFVLNLRLLGGILREVPAREVERATRPWLWAGIIGTVVTGAYMGIATVVTLLPNGAFFVKMLALAAAIGLSLAISRQVRDETSGREVRATPLALAAIVLWLAALTLFATTTGLSSGALLVALAGFGLFAAVLVTYRRLYLALLLALAAAAVLLAIGGRDALAGPALVVLALLGAVGLGWLEARRTPGPMLSAERIGALSSSLAWVTVAAAGRWIGFS